MARSRLLPGVLILNLAAAPAFAGGGETAPPPPVPPPVAPQTVQEHVEPAPAKVTPWPFVLAGAGALTIGTGIWLIHRDDSDGPAPACTSHPGAPTTCPYRNGTFWQGWAVVAIGAQLAIAGVAWRLYEVRHAKTSVSVVAGLGDLSVVGRF